MNKRLIRNYIRFTKSLVFSFLYLPHLAIYRCGGVKKYVIDSDLKQLEMQIGFKLCRVFQLLYHLHTNSYLRTLFYRRIGVVWG